MMIRRVFLFCYVVLALSGPVRAARITQDPNRNTTYHRGILNKITDSLTTLGKSKREKDRIIKDRVTRRGQKRLRAAEHNKKKKVQKRMEK
jgi:hypothetical protein